MSLGFDREGSNERTVNRLIAADDVERDGLLLARWYCESH
jgi:hypothetical protein